MTEAETIQRTEIPLTASSLAERLRTCGMDSGQTVLVHMAMSKLGWVIGGAEAIILAFLDVLGEGGTLMMPTHTTNNTDPCDWQHPPVPESWWQRIRDHTPAYNPATTPTREMGAVPELFRTWPGTIRSSHPVVSFAARGPNAEYLLEDHHLLDHFGNRSPVGKLYELDGHVVLLGVDHRNNTSLHLAEFRAEYAGKHSSRTGSAMTVGGKRQWVVYEVPETDADDFGELGQAFDAAHNITVHYIQQAEVRVFKQRLAVDFAANWIEQNRGLIR